MNYTKDICIITQARLSSERVPKKMIKPFANTTLFDIICEKLEYLMKRYSFKCYVSIYEQELLDIAHKYDINIFHRSEESAKCDSGIQLMYEWWDKLPHTHVVLVNGCMPFLSESTILRFADKYYSSYDANDGMFAIIPKKDYFWNAKGNMLNNWPEGQDLLNTKAVETTYQAAHALYGSRLDWIGQGKFVGSYQKFGDPKFFRINNEYECLDIDYQWQFKMCEVLYENKTF